MTQNEQKMRKLLEDMVNPMKAADFNGAPRGYWAKQIEEVLRSTEAAPVARADRAAETGWKKPWEEPPPKGTKLFLLTAGRCATTGLWGKDCIAWAPLFTLDEELREYAHAVFMGKGEEFIADLLDRKAELRMNVIGQNGNTGEHYDAV